MRNIPDDAMDAFRDGEDEENAKPENSTPAARARRALGSSPFSPVTGPYTATIEGEPYAWFGARDGIVLMRDVAASGKVSINETIAAAMGAERHHANLLALHAWLDNFDGNVPVRVFGVPVDAKRLHRTFVAFADAPTHYATASVQGRTNDGTPADIKVFVLADGCTTVGITALTDAKHCVAAWPIPDGVRE